MQRKTIIAITLTSAFLCLLGLGGIIIVILYTLPTLGPRWLLYFFTTSGLTGLALPAITFLNYRFPSNPPPDGGVLIRQSIWVGIYGSLLIWLQTGRFLNPPLILFLAIGFILIEFIVRWAERSRWQPKVKHNGS